MTKRCTAGSEARGYGACGMLRYAPQPPYRWAGLNGASPVARIIKRSYSEKSLFLGL